MRELSLDWVAGFFDGEGCVYIHRHRKKGRIDKGRSRPNKSNGYSTVVSVSNTHKEVLDRLQRRFGGTVDKGSSGRPNCKPIWAWHLRSKQAAAFLEMMLPRLEMKRRQAEIGIELQETKRPLTKEVTMKHVAREAGVALSTCYECMRHGRKSRFSNATVDLVRAAAARMGYKKVYFEIPSEIIEKQEALRQELTILNQKGATNPPSSSPHR